MPTTSGGVDYTTTDHTNTTGGLVSLTVPENFAGNVILFFHGAGGVYNQFMTHSGFASHRERELTAGSAILELAGGPDDTAELLGKQNWNGSHTDLEVQQALSWAFGIITPVRVCTWGRSMGNGLGSQTHCFNSDLQPYLVGHINHSGVTDWVQAYKDGRFAAYLPARFGAANYPAGLSTYTTNVAGRDPISFGSAWNGRRVLCVVGDADVTVPMLKHGKLFYDTYSTALDPRSQIVIVPDGTHNNDSTGTYNDPSIGVFLASVFQRDTTPPIRYGYEVQMSVVIGGSEFSIKPEPLVRYL